MFGIDTDTLVTLASLENLELMPGTYHSTMHTHAHGTHDGIYRIERSRCARAQGVLGACGSYNIAQTIIYSLSLLLLVTGCQAAQRLLSRNILGAALWPAQRRQERERAVTKCGGCERACGGDASRIFFFGCHTHLYAKATP